VSVYAYRVSVSVYRLVNSQTANTKGPKYVY